MFTVSLAEWPMQGTSITAALCEQVVSAQMYVMKTGQEADVVGGYGYTPRGGVA